MPKARSNGTWRQVRNVLFEMLSEALELQRVAPVGSARRRDAQKLIDRIVELLKEHADSGLRQINDSAATRTALAAIKRGSASAKRESDRIQRATAVFDEVSALIDELAALVGGLTNLVS